ncbi:hypothetical protein F3Y22_tig00110429pilonHSYRG00978 [Hibiscus syriacus]|uniref:Integrase catalytic domain-containing protein n=1 Tax=Hibiscus syriacus TaxID=106335 RepID=A0A6A3APU5_HIBSY|nr:hypothetical protein F3Y22_tig00110429pilonHSYRG00978 [Hibiscus syriacus]
MSSLTPMTRQFKDITSTGQPVRAGNGSEMGRVELHLPHHPRSKSPSTPSITHQKFHPYPLHPSSAGGDYKKFWENFGRFLKLGCIEDTGNHKRITPLLRFYTSKNEEELTSLDEYVQNMGENQKAIYYLATDSLKSAMTAPFLEKLVQKDIEVLYLIEPIDEVAIQNLQTYKEKKFVDISKEHLELAMLFISYGFGLHLMEFVVIPGDEHVVDESTRAWRYSKFGVHEGKEDLEINPDHPIIKDLNAACKNAPESSDAKRAVDLLYDTALISGGFTPDSPTELGSKIYEMMAMALGGRSDDETLKIVGRGDIRLKLPNQTTWKLKATDPDGKSNLWHQRLCHMSEKGMKTLLTKGKLPDLKNVDVGLFPSLAGSLYYVTFIDDSTRNVWDYFLKKKSKVFDTFRKWNAMVENETGLKVKRLRFDNRGEYRNNRFRDFCANNGIKIETTVPMTPQQNGAEAINTATYLINHGPSVYLDGGIPEEAWSKKEINLSHLRVSTIESSSSNIEAETKEFAEFKKISGNDVKISPEAVQEEPGTPELRRSSRIPKPTQHYSPSLHYLLLTDNSEPECYDEAMQVEDSVKLKKSLYGLKQAPRQWYKKFDSFMSSSGFTRCQADHYCYIKRFDISFIILLLYVDDMLVAGSYMQEIINLKQKLSKQFAMKDLGAAKQILGMRIKRDTNSGTLMLSQAEYINKVLSRLNIQDAKPVSTHLGVHFRLSKEQSPKTEEERAHMVKVPYASTIRSLMYAMVCTRLDISHAVGAVSRYMNNPGKVRWEAVKWILRYMRGTTNKTLYFKAKDTILTGYVDTDLAKNVDIRRSTTGYVYTLGGTAVSWVSQLQKIVALSTTEAKYVAVTEASKEMVWLQSFLEELGKKQENNVLYCDSQSDIHLTTTH